MGNGIKLPRKVNKAKNSGYFGHHYSDEVDSNDSEEKFDNVKRKGMEFETANPINKKEAKDALDLAEDIYAASGRYPNKGKSIKKIKKIESIQDLKDIRDGKKELEE